MSSRPDRARLRCGAPGDRRRRWCPHRARRAPGATSRTGSRSSAPPPTPSPSRAPPPRSPPASGSPTRRACRSSPAGRGPASPAGACASEGGIVIAVTRMARILEVDYANQLARGRARAREPPPLAGPRPARLYYAPDPSSQLACTIGGNVANNSGGPHTLKYGVTTNHVLGVEVVLPDGEVVWLGGEGARSPGLRPGRALRGLRGHVRDRRRRSSCGSCAVPRRSARSSRCSTSSTRRRGPWRRSPRAGSRRPRSR